MVANAISDSMLYGMLFGFVAGLIIYSICRAYK